MAGPNASQVLAVFAGERLERLSRVRVRCVRVIGVQERIADDLKTTAFRLRSVCVKNERRHPRTRHGSDGDCPLATVEVLALPLHLSGKSEDELLSDAVELCPTDRVLGNSLDTIDPEARHGLADVYEL